MSSGANIVVAIKNRPILKKELDLKLHSAWKIIKNSIQLSETRLKECDPFYFDHIFNESSTNEDVFNVVAKPIVHAAIKGFNGTIFAYGQTASGKTYTMLGDKKNPGVIQLASKELFKEIENSINREFLLRVGYIEIYNEKIYDLLEKNSDELKIHEPTNGDITVNCKESIIKCEEDIIQNLQVGNKLRKIGETNMNERSSRSHAIFRIIIESRDVNHPDSSSYQISILNLVDLAGSERADQTGSTGSRFKEGVSINKSLLSLSLVISTLSQNQADSLTKFVNYRDSKLTRILQASLGGNALTAIICTINPTVIEETNSTLSFAMRAKSIKNQPHVNEITSDATMIKRLEKEIHRLSRELEEEKKRNDDRLVEMESTLKAKILEREKTIVHSHAISKERKTRRETWGPSSLCTKKMETIIEESRKELYLATPLITSRVTCSPDRDSDLPIPLIEEPFRTPMPFRKTNSTECPTPCQTEKYNYEQLEQELVELETFTNLEKKLGIEYDAFEAMKNTLDESKKRIEELSVENFRLKQLKLDMTDEELMKDYKTKYEMSENRNKKLENDLKDNVSKREKLAESISQYLNKIDVLELELNKKNSIEFETEAHLDRAKGRINELLSVIEEREKTIVNLENQIKSKDLKKPSVGKVCKETQSNNSNLMKIEGALKQLESIQNENDQLSTQLMDALEESDALKNRCNEHEMTIRNLEAKLTDVSEQLGKQLRPKKSPSYVRGNTYSENNYQKILQDQSYFIISKESNGMRIYVLDKSLLNIRILENILKKYSILPGCFQNNLKSNSLLSSQDLQNLTSFQIDEKISALDSKLLVFSNQIIKSCSFHKERRNNFTLFNGLRNKLKFSNGQEFSIHMGNRKMHENDKFVQETCDSKNKKENLDFMREKENMEKELSAINEVLKKVENERDSMQTDKIRLQENIKDLQAKIDSLQETAMKFESNLEISEKNLSQYKLENNSLTDTLAKLRNFSDAERIAFTHDKEKLTAEIGNLQRDNNLLEEKCNNFLQQQTELNDELCSMQEELKVTKNRYKQYELELKNENSLLSDKIKETEMKLKEEKELLEHKILSLKEEMNEYTQKINKITKLNEKLEQNLVKAKEEINEYEKEKDRLMKETKEPEKLLDKANSEIDSLKKTLSNITEVKSLLEKDLELEKAKLCQCESEKNTALSQLEEMKDILRNEKQRILNEKIMFTKELEEKKHEFNNSYEKLLKKYEKSQQDVRSRNEELIIALEQLNNKDYNLTVEIERLRVEKDSVKSTADKVNLELLKYKNDYNSATKTVHNLQDQLKQEKENSKIISDDKDSLMKTLTETKEHNNRLNTEIELLKNSLQRHTAELELLKQKDKEYHTKYEKMEGKLSELKKDKSDLEVRVQQLKNNNEELISELKTLKEIENKRRQQDHEEIKRVQSDLRNLQNIKNDFEKEIKSKLNTLEIEHHHLQEKLKHSEHSSMELKNLRITTCDLEEKLKEVNLQKDKLQNSYDQSIKLIENAEKECKILNSWLHLLLEKMNETHLKAASTEEVKNTDVALKFTIGSLNNNQNQSDKPKRSTVSKDNPEQQPKHEALPEQQEKFEYYIHFLEEFNSMKDALLERIEKLMKIEENNIKIQCVCKQQNEKNNINSRRFFVGREKIQQKRICFSEREENPSSKHNNNNSNSNDGCDNDGDRSPKETKTDKLQRELQSMKKNAENERKSHRQGIYDEKRWPLWNNNRDASIQTDSNENKFSCSCAELRKTVSSLQRDILIKDSHINTLKMESRCNPLKERNEELKNLLEVEETERRKLEIQLSKLKSHTEIIEREKKELILEIEQLKTSFNKLERSFVKQSKFAQTDLSAHSIIKLENDLETLTKKYDQLKEIARLRKTQINELNAKLNREKEKENQNPMKITLGNEFVPEERRIENNIKKEFRAIQTDISMEILQKQEEDVDCLRTQCEQLKIVCRLRAEEIKDMKQKLEKEQNNDDVDKMKKELNSLKKKYAQMKVVLMWRAERISVLQQKIDLLQGNKQSGDEENHPIEPLP